MPAACRDPTRAEVQEVLEAINNAAITTEQLEDMLQDEPKVVVFRNEVRMLASRALAVKTAAKLGKRLVVWHAADTRTDGAKLPKEVQSAVNMAHAKKTGDINGWTCFYEGIPYVFIDNKCPTAGRVKNNKCIGRALLLDAREPPDDPQQKVRFLQYPPSAVFVQPSIIDVGDACHNVCKVCPPGCIPVTMATKTFSISFPEPIPLRRGGVCTKARVRRRNIPLGDGFAFTDYYTQGMSFGKETWLADMRPPPTGHIDRASVAVVLSRFATWSKFKAFTSLWPAETPDMSLHERRLRHARKEFVVDYYWQLSKMHPDLRAEMHRLRGLAEQTEAALLRKFAALLPPELLPTSMA